MEGRRNSAAARRNSGFRNSIIAVGAVLIVAIWAAAIALVWTEREDAIQEAERNALNLTLGFSEQIARSLTAINEAMDFLEADYTRDGPGFDLYAWAQRQHTVAALESHISIAGPDGRIRATSLAPGIPGVDISDREHFSVHLSGNSGTLYVSKPVIGRQTGQWTVEVTRRMDRPDGTFAGVLIFALDPNYLIRLYEPADLGDAGTVALVGLDGVLRARLGAEVDPNNSKIGTVFKSELFSSIISNESGVEIQPSTLDSIKRIFAYRRVQGYPLDVVVSLGYDEVLAKPNRAALRILIVTGFATLVLATLLFSLVVEINRRSRRELELASERTKLEVANRDLELSRNAAEAASRAKSEFLANMSHELRTPLNAIIGFAELMRDELMGPLGHASYKEYAQHIHDSGNHLLAEINNILDLSKVEAGSLKLREEEVDLAEVIKARVDAFRSSAVTAGLELIVELAGVPRAVIADEGRVRQMLDNLLSNAVKFTPKGGRIAARLRAAKDGGAEIQVEDTGIGMAAEDIARSVEPFRQIDSSLSRKFGGTGLGLSLVKRLAELHGGSLAIQSAPGKGTLVTIKFPKERVFAGAQAADRRAAGADGH
jgi:signal transduction histidine kinase